MTTSESFRRDVAERLDGVLKSGDPHAHVDFPSCLSAEERKYIHHIAEQFGLKHDSRGKGDARFITVRRDPAKLERRSLGGANSQQQLALSKESLDALRHPLLLHASTPKNIEALAQGAPLLPVGRDEVAQLFDGASAREEKCGFDGIADQSPLLPAPASVSRSGSTRPRRPIAAICLPVQSVRENLLRAVAEHAVTIVVGETGCGKSTQVPQFLVEEDIAANVVVTQPRRLSAVALAHRVAQEREEDVGRTVGYSVHLDHAASADTRLLFCTSGVFRRRLLADPELSTVTHLILDELHEREKIADFLLIAVRDLLEIRPSLRIVLMSATMQHETFTTFFPGCAEISVPGRVYPVDEFFLENIAPVLHRRGSVQELGPGFAAGGLGYGSWDDKGSEKSFKYQVLVSHFHDRDGLCGYAANSKKPLNKHRLEEGLFLHDVLQQTKGVVFDLPIIVALLLAIIDEGCNKNAPALPGRRSGGVLIFLPGWDDIDRLKRRLRAHPVLGDQSRFWVLPLHSQIRLEQQKEVFKTPPAGVSKIVLSTNIAETSITIDDITNVIDCGRAKETSYDACLGIPTLNTSWISKASMIQRSGRAGRTAPGVCYRIFSRRRYEQLDEHRPPEMLRSTLEDVCLHAKLLLTRKGQERLSILEFLQRAPDPPEVRSVENADRLLREIGAFTDDTLGNLTALGVRLSALPLQAQLAKIVVWAHLLGVGDDALAVVSGLQYREPFVSIDDAHQSMSLAEANKFVRQAKQELCGNFHSDHFALFQASQLFAEACRHGSEAARDFCAKYSLSFRQLHTIQQTLTKLRRELKSRGLWHDHVASRHSGDVALLAAAICGGLFPNVAQATANGEGSSKLKASGGRMEALPHPSSVQSHTNRRTKGRTGPNDQWFCFNEMSQVEDHYSLVGLTPIPHVAMLLLAGEGPLLIRNSESTNSACNGIRKSYAKCESTVVQELQQGSVAQGGVFGKWWSASISSTCATSSTSNHAAVEGTGFVAKRREVKASGAGNNVFANWWQRATDNAIHAESSDLEDEQLRSARDIPCPVEADSVDHQDEVVLSITGLDDWFAVRVDRDVAQQLQALRGMLKLLFRTFCNNPSQLCKAIAEGEPGYIVLDIVTKLIRAGMPHDTGHEQPSPKGVRSTWSGVPQETSAVSMVGNGSKGSVSYFPRTTPAAPAKEQRTRERLANSTNVRHHKDVQQWPCGYCGRATATHNGGYDPSDGMWYCSMCWGSYAATQ